jgi:hypothetical protein
VGTDQVGLVVAVLRRRRNGLDPAAVLRSWEGSQHIEMEAAHCMHHMLDDRRKPAVAVVSLKLRAKIRSHVGP